MFKQSKAAHLSQGEHAEEQAHQFLISKGLKPVCRNFRCKVGEIDLIMLDGNALVIVEVKYRKNDKYGSALESVTKKKQSRIIAATHCYLKSNNSNQAIRFDVIAISGNNNINWVRNAFQTSY